MTTILSLYLMLTDTELINGYYTFLLNTRRPKTAMMYKFHLKKYSDYLHKLKKSLHISTAQDLQSYINSNSRWGSTIKRHCFIIVKTFFSKYYLPRIPVGVTTEELRVRLTRESEVREIIEYPIPRKESLHINRALTIDQLRKLLDHAKKSSLLDYCVLWIYFYFGLRRIELLRMSPIDNINWKENKMIITSGISKTHTARTLYFNNYTRNVLIQILKVRGNRDKILPLEETQINKLFSKYDKVAGMHLHPHMARYTFNTEMLKSLKGNVEIDEKLIVRSLMGHTNQGADAMTILYADLVDISKSAMMQYHYMDKLFH